MTVHFRIGYFRRSYRFSCNMVLECDNDPLKMCSILELEHCEHLITS